MNHGKVDLLIIGQCQTQFSLGYFCTFFSCTATPMAVVLRAAAAQHRMRQAHSAEIYIRSVSSGLRASPYLVSTPATPEIHAAALLCLLRGDQQWDRARAPKRLKKKKKKEKEEGEKPRPKEDGKRRRGQD